MLDLSPLGDAAVVVQLGTTIDEQTHRRVTAFADALEREPILGLIEIVPAFTTVTVFYDPFQVLLSQMGRVDLKERSPYEIVCSQLREIANELQESVSQKPTTVEIPVCYGGEFGPDLSFVAKHNGLSEEEVIQIHSRGEYLVYMIGFAPGFPYLGGMSAKIAAPRRTSPRLKIPLGTVGIAGMQTGVYPIETPGGWQLIGRTPTKLFRPDANPPSLLQAGNLVRFTPISRADFDAWEEGDA